MSGSRASLTARPAPSEPYVQVALHTAQASASAYEVDRGERPGQHQRWTRTRVVSPVARSRRTTTLMLPPCSRSGSATVLQAAHRRLGTLENPAISPLIHKMKCYTNALKSHTERVRPQFLSLRQDYLGKLAL